MSIPDRRLLNGSTIANQFAFLTPGAEVTAMLRLMGAA